MSRAEEMRGVFARWKSSGQSLMAFSKTEGVPYQKLLYWRRKLGDVAAGKAKPAAKDDLSSSLVPLHVVADPPPIGSHSIKIEVWLSNGLALDVPPGFDADELRRLVGVLLTC